MSFEGGRLRIAAALIQKGHTRGANARDERDRACRITSPDAKAFSLYGAISRAFGADDVTLQSGSAYRDLWSTVTNAATDRLKEMGLDPRNSHPIFYLNDVPGFNAAAAADFLVSVAERYEKVANTVKNGAAT